MKAHSRSSQATEYQGKGKVACAAAEEWDEPRLLSHPLT